ncbi:unnamed protein product [Diamesa serratosioi]
MNAKLLSCLLILLLGCVCIVNAHGHSHDGHDHGAHGHSHGKEANPSFKYSRAANAQQQAPKKVVEEKHHHHHDHDHAHDHHDDHDHHVHQEKVKDVKRDVFDMWLHSIGSTLLISAAPFFILYLVPLDNTEKMQPRLKTLLAFASGGLLGDAFLHLIPHAITPHDHSSHSHSHGGGHDEPHSHSHDMWVGLWVLCGIITFLAVEKLVRILKGDDHHGHSHGGSAPTTTTVTTKDKESDKKDAVKQKKDKNEKSSKVTKKEEAKPKETMKVAGYLNLAADFTHNFTDGLAIGASYMAGNSVGIVTTITILLHEVPHEIGDFAILIKSGCSKKKAMMLQLSTALGALAGNVIALLGNSDTSAPSWILPFTAGGFIYIATVSVIPELLEQSTKLGQSLKEIVALLAGVGMMVLIVLVE